MSRRTFLALAASVAAACTDNDDGSAPDTGGTVGRDGTPDTGSPSTDRPATTTSTSSTTTSTVAPTTTTAALDADPFTLGVASGDPDETSVVLWTRLTGPLPTVGIDVEWEAVDGAGAVVAGGTTTTNDEIGGAVHVVAEVTAPVEYRFRAGGFESPTGRTAPVGERDELRLASASCQNFEHGYYAAHRDLAEWRPDLVLFLGDFVYEGDAGDPATSVRTHEGPEPTDLDGYRARYATYLADPDLQAARAACPWLVVWDDHEVENNYAGQVPEEEAAPGAFEARRAQAYRAWWEQMPTRLPRPAIDQPEFPIHRGVDVGSLVRISALDGRQYRSDQLCTTTLDAGPPCEGWDDPDRTMLGAQQEAWLAERFASSTADWNCVAQQTVMTDLRVPVTGGILNYDQWDGYHPARERLLAGSPSDLIVVTGDIHLAGVGQLTSGGDAVGVEFVTTAISSRPNVDPSLEPLVASLPDIVDAELTSRGYTRHVLTRETWTAEYRTVDDVLDPESGVSTWRTFTVDRGVPTVR